MYIGRHQVTYSYRGLIIIFIPVKWFPLSTVRFFLNILYTLRPLLIYKCKYNNSYDENIILVIGLPSDPKHFKRVVFVQNTCCLRSSDKNIIYM